MKLAYSGQERLGSTPSSAAVIVRTAKTVTLHLVRWDGLMCYLETTVLPADSIQLIRPFDQNQDHVDFPCTAFARSVALINQEGSIEKYILADDASFVSNML